MNTNKESVGLWRCPQAPGKTVEPGTCSGLELLQPLPLAPNSLSKQRVTLTLSNGTMTEMERWRTVHCLDCASSKDLHDRCCAWTPCWLLRSMQLPGNGVGERCRCLWSSCCQKSFWYLWSVFPCETLLVFMDLITTERHVCACGLSCCLRSCWSPCSVLTLDATWKLMICATSGWYGQGSFFGCAFNYCRLIIKRQWTLLWQTLHLSDVGFPAAVCVAFIGW